MKKEDLKGYLKEQIIYNGKKCTRWFAMAERFLDCIIPEANKENIEKALNIVREYIPADRVCINETNFSIFIRLEDCIMEIETGYDAPHPYIYYTEHRLIIAS